MEPVRLGQHELLIRLAAGGAANVFLVRDTHSDPAQLRALKILLPSLSSNEDFLKMFFTEAKIAAQLQHPNAVGITGFGQVDGIYCLGMEYVFGASLAQVLRASARAKKPLTVGVLLRITSQVCDALHYAHELKDERGQTMGLVHRDVTPQNILIGFNGVPKLTDFGIAKATNRGWETQAGIVKGKFSYMSPEQALGKKVDRRSDIFGAGIVLWEALTGRDLFKGSTPMEVLTNIREQKIEPPSKVVPGLTPIVDPIVMKALKRAPRQRYQTAAEMRDEIEDLIRRAGVNIDAQTISRELATIYGDDIVERAFALRSAMAGRADLEHLAKVLGGSKLEPKHLPEKRGGRNDPDPLGLFGPGSNGSWDIPRSESIDLPNPARMERSFSEAPPSSGEFEIVDSPEPEADEEFPPFDDDHHRAIESMVPNERIVTGWEDSTAAAGARRDELLSMLSEEDATIGILPPEFAERFGQELRRALDDEDDAHFDDELTVGMPNSPELAELRALNFDDPSGMWGAEPEFGKVPEARTEALPASYGLRPVPRARQASSQESLRPVPRAPSLDMERPVPRAPSLDMDERTPYPEFEPGPFDPTDEPPLPSRPPLRPPPPPPRGADAAPRSPSPMPALAPLEESDSVPPSMPGEVVLMDDPLEAIEPPLPRPLDSPAVRSLLGDASSGDLSPDALRALASDPMPHNGAVPPELIDGLVVPPPPVDQVLEVEQKQGIRVSVTFLLIFALLLVALGVTLGLVFSGTI